MISITKGDSMIKVDNR